MLILKIAIKAKDFIRDREGQFIWIKRIYSLRYVTTFILCAPNIYLSKYVK